MFTAGNGQRDRPPPLYWLAQRPLWTHSNRILSVTVAGGLACAALPVAVSVQPVGVDTGNLNGYGFLCCGEVPTVESVTLEVGYAGAVVGMASLLPGAGGRHVGSRDGLWGYGHDRCRQWGVLRVVGTSRDDVPQGVNLGGVSTQLPSGFDMHPRCHIPASLVSFGWQPRCGILRAFLPVRPRRHRYQGMLVTQVVGEALPCLSVPGMSARLPRFLKPESTDWFPRGVVRGGVGGGLRGWGWSIVEGLGVWWVWFGGLGGVGGWLEVVRACVTRC